MGITEIGEEDQGNWLLTVSSGENVSVCFFENHFHEIFNRI